MAISPDTTVRLYKNIPFDKGREHTYKFSLKTEQEYYFREGVLHPYTEFTHNVRINMYDRTMRLGIAYKDAYEANYVAFINESTGHEDKWFYAFVDFVEYRNPNVSIIHFSIDYIQTYLFDFDVLPCLVEREHTKTDELGEHILPEGLEIGETVLNSNLKYHSTVLNSKGYIPLHFTEEFAYILYSTRDVYEYLTGQESSPPYYKRESMVNNIVQPYEVIYCDDGDALDACFEVLEFYGHADSVIALFTMPKAFIDFTHCITWFPMRSGVSSDPAIKRCGELRDVIDATTGRVTSTVCRPVLDSDLLTYTDGQGTTHNIRNTLTIPYFSNSSGSIDGYNPYNNKLFSAPFTYIELSDNNGHCAIIKQELYDAKTNLSFKAIGSLGANPAIMAYPYDYRNSDDDYESGVVQSGVFDVVPWTIDMYRQWVTQNAGKLALSFASGALAIASPILGAAVGTTVNAITSGMTTYTYSAEVQNRAPSGRFAPGTHTELKQDTNAMQEIERDTQMKRYGSDTAIDTVSGMIKCASVLADIGAHTFLPPTVEGQINNGTINTTSKHSELADFFVRIYTLRNDFAKRIDEYFSRFGYSVNAFKIPNIFDATNGVPRPRWNYLKTADAKVVAKSGHFFSADVEENIEAILNRGITFWDASVDIGNYTQTSDSNNKPLTN